MGANSGLILKDLKKIKGIDDHVASVYQNYINAKEVDQRYLNRNVKNWRNYVGVDAELGFGQWSPEAVGFMQGQGRQLLTYNFIKPIVDRIAGGIMAAPFDPEFIPVGKEVTSLTKAIKTAMYSDKELMDWNGVYFQLVKAGLVFEGVIKMIVSNEYHDLGNIGFEYCLPGSVVRDPMWRSWRSKDMEVAWQEQYLQPDKLLDICPDAEDVIRSHIDSLNAYGPQYGYSQGATPYTNDHDNWGTALRLISQYKMINETYKQDYAVTETGDVAIPRKLKTPSDKIHWLNANVPTWQPDHIYEKEQQERKCVVTRICPSIAWHNSLENKYTEIQTGRLPFHFWSASRDNGEPHSIVDSIVDAQQNINYWEALITNKIQTEGGGGAQFADRSAFVDDPEFDRFCKMRNHPGETFETRPGYLGTGGSPSKPVNNSQFPREAYEHLNHIITVLIPWISKVTPASRGEGEASNESGYLYKLKTIQSEQQLYTLHYGLRVFWNEVYEAYLMQAAQTYSNEGIPRTFAVDKGKQSVVLNEEIKLPDGRIGVKNDAQQLRNIRHKIIITEQQQTPSKKIEDLNVITEYSKTIDPNTQPATKQFLQNKSASLIDQFDESDKEIIEALGQKELELALVRIESATLQEKLNIAQLQAALQQAQTPQQPQPSMDPNQVNNQGVQPQAAQSGAPIQNEPQAQLQGV